MQGINCHMNHPQPEEWAPYLYKEDSPEVHRRLKAHLQSCPECQARLDTWKTSLKQLDRWKLPTAHTAREGFVPVLKWGFAAALLVLAGFAAGRLTGEPDMGALQASLLPELRAQLARDLSTTLREEIAQANSSTLSKAGQYTDQTTAGVAKAWETQRADDRRGFEAAFERLHAQRVADLLLLKKQLDILAVNTDVGLRETALQLAAYPAAYPSPSENDSSEKNKGLH
jgi:hypothetical protein